MGIETSTSDVEESTEPPLREPHPDPGGEKLHLNHPILTCAIRQEKPDHATLPGTVHGPWEQEYRYAHTLEPADVSKLLDVDLQHGLGSDEAASRLRRDGPNKIEDATGVSWWKILLRQVSNSLTLVLLMTMALSFGINDFIEGAVITAVILLNIIVGFVQDYNAEKTILSLRTLSAPITKVLRDGRVESVKAESLVIGDIVQVTLGDIVPADLRLFDGMNFLTDEALLTGESLPAAKQPQKTFSVRDLPTGDRLNMAYSGTTVTQGRATGIVVSTGMKTEIGKIARLLRTQPAKVQSSNKFARSYIALKVGVKNILGLTGTPLQVKLSKFALLLFGLAILLAIIVFSANEWNVEGEVLLYGICVAVAVIPESLIAVLTITVAVGTKAMAKQNVIVRKLQALEAVGGVTNICSDKTGTLTQGKMIARKAWIPRAGTMTVHDTSSPLDPASGLVKINGLEVDKYHKGISSGVQMIKFLDAIALCNLSSVYCLDQKDSVEKSSVGLQTNWSAIGDPTEIALQVMAMRFQHGKPRLLEDGNKFLLAEFPFDSAIKRMTMVYKDRTTGISEAFMKGALEVILPMLTNSEDEKSNIRYMGETLAAEGLRVLCIAHKTILNADEGQVSERDLTEANLEFVGLVGLYDPPRLETKDAVKRCRMAGISVHMLTGDHLKTATAIAYDVGILSQNIPVAQANTLVMPADRFDKMSETEIDQLEALPLVLARCSPTTKVRMIEALHRRKAFCVMTGDGVNDSPALRRADVGIAMGLNGSDVAKEAADMVLTDDDFASMVKAIEEGRRLFANIQKFLMHLLISNIAQVVLLLISLAFKDTAGNSVFPLSPLQILWVNLITSSFLALGLGMEEAQPDVMLRPPHDLRIGVFTRELITDKMIYGTFMGSLCLVAFVAVVYGGGNGDLGTNCNQEYNDSCDVVFRARATVYATLSFLLLLTAWEVKHFSRSLFNLDPTHYSGPFSVFRSVWRNRFLFYAVVAGFVIVFPVVYLPAMDKIVFKHMGISWEWGIVLGCVVVYLGLVESWKATKRAFGIGSGKNLTITEGEAEKGNELA